MPPITGNVFLRISPLSPHQVLVKRWNKTDGVVSHGADGNAVGSNTFYRNKYQEEATQVPVGKIASYCAVFPLSCVLEVTAHFPPAHFILSITLIGSSLDSLIRTGRIKVKSLKMSTEGLLLHQYLNLHSSHLRRASIPNINDIIKRFYLQ